VPAGDRWVHEIKFDGYRVQVHLRDAAVKVFTRRGNDWTNRFSKIANEAWHINAGSAIIDGEVVVPSADGTTDFSVLQKELKGRSGPAAQMESEKGLRAADLPVMVVLPMLSMGAGRSPRGSVSQPQRDSAVLPSSNPRIAACPRSTSYVIFALPFIRAFTERHGGRCSGVARGPDYSRSGPRSCRRGC
jgi:hypothetical protein